MEVRKEAHVQVLPVVFGVVDLNAHGSAYRHQLDTNLHRQDGEARAREVN